MPNKYVRRLLTIPVVLILAPVLAVGWPLVLVLAALRDLVVDRERWPTVRVSAMLVLAVWLEATGVMIAGLTWILSLGGRIHAIRDPLSYWTVKWWTTGLLGAARLTVGLKMEFDPHLPETSCTVRMSWETSQSANNAGAA